MRAERRSSSNISNTFKEEQGREVVIGVVEDLGERALSPRSPRRSRAGTTFSMMRQTSRPS